MEELNNKGKQRYHVLIIKFKFCINYLYERVIPFVSFNISQQSDIYPKPYLLK